MGTEKADIHILGISSTTTSPVAYEGTEQWWDGSSSIFNLSFLSPSPSLFPHSGHPILHGPPAIQPSTAYPNYISLCQTGGLCNATVECTSGQDIRRPSVLLEARRWASPPSFAGQCAASKSLASPLTVNLGPDGSDPLLDGSHGLRHSEPITFDREPVFNTAPKFPSLPYMQSVPDPSSEFVGSTRCQQGNFDANLGHTSSTGGALLSSGTIENTTNVINDDKERPIVIYRAPERKGLGRHSKHAQACVINIEGLWIDRDDLYYGARGNNSMMNVHECRWALFSNPCQMWIIGCNSRIGAHVRKWHGGLDRIDTKKTTRCQWDGCAKTMLKSSIHRHIVTTHLEEALHCKGCDQQFSRKDVYNKHFEDNEPCVGAGAMVVYGAPYMEIDVRQVLHSEGQFVTRADKV